MKEQQIIRNVIANCEAGSNPVFTVFLDCFGLCPRNDERLSTL
jgi:hypothetical protein